MNACFKIFCLLGIFVGCFTLASCQHTVEGFGQDMQRNGQEIQKSVRN